MAYNPEYDFSSYQGSNPTSPLPGGALDNELAAIAAETGSLASKVNDVRRSDGALANGIVTPDSLHSSTTAFLDDKQNDAAESATAAAASASAAATSATGASGSATAAASSASAAAASAAAVSSLAGSLDDDVVAAESAADAAATSAANAAASAAAASTSAGTASTAATTATTKATEAATSAGSASTSATVATDAASTAGVQAASATTEALAAVAAAENASDAADAAASHALAAEAVLDELAGLELEIEPLSFAFSRSSDLTITDANVASLQNIEQEWTISDGTDRVITIEIGAFTHADPDARLHIPLHRFGSGAGALKVEFENEPGTATTPSPCGNWAIYGAADNDDVANTAGSPMFDAALPTQTLVGAAGNDRLAVSCLMIQCNQPVQSTRVATCTIDGVSATIAIPIDQEIHTDGDPIIAVAVKALADQASGNDAGHPVIWTTNASSREGQAILSCVFKDVDLDSPYEGVVRDATPFDTLTSDGTNFVNSLALDPGSETNRYALAFHMGANGNLTGVTGAGGSESVAPANTGTTSSRAITYLVRALADISSSTTFSFKRLIANPNVPGNCVGFLLRPKTTPGVSGGTVLVDGNGAAELTRENQSALLRLFPDGVTAHLCGA